MIRYVAAALLLRVVDGGATVGLVLLCTSRAEVVDDPIRTAGLLGAALTAPHLAGPLTARWLDRARDPRWVIALFAVAYAGMFSAAVVSLGRIPLGAVAALVLLAGFCGPMLTGGLSSLLPGLRGGVAPRRRSSLDALTYGIAASAGPALVTVLGQALTPVTALAILIGCAVVGSVVTMAVPVDRASEPIGRSVGLRTVLRHIVRQPALRRVSVLTWITSFVAAALLLLGIARLHVLAPGQGGWVAAGFGLGLLVGSLLLVIRPPNTSADRGMLWSTVVMMPLAVLACLLEHPTALVVVFGLLGILTAGQATYSLAARAEYSSAVGRSGVFMTVAAVKIAFSSAGTAIAGLLAESGAPVLVAVFAGVLLMAAGWAAFDFRAGTAVHGSDHSQRFVPGNSARGVERY